MFGFGKNKNLERIYIRLNEEIYFGTKRAEQVISKNVIRELQTYTTDIETVVAMAGIVKQAQFAEDFLKTVHYEKLIEEFKEQADQKGVSFGDVFNDEVDGQVDAAKQYGEKLAERFENGDLDGSKKVRDFCAEYATDMISAWISYRLKMREKSNYWED